MKIACIYPYFFVHHPFQVKLLLGHCYWVTVTGSLLPGHCYCVTVTVSLVLCHCYWPLPDNYIYGIKNCVHPLYFTCILRRNIVHHYLSLLPYRWDLGSRVLTQHLPAKTSIGCFNGFSKI